ncbi:o-succinylbenzoate synthase [Chromatium weissei]|nr:o-succinylbenzoate synthase [Chromatium weissei]
MRIERFQITAYDLPLRCHWATARGELNRRRGWLLQVSAAGLHGFGDCAPLPAAGTETVAAAKCALSKIQTVAVGHEVATLLDALKPKLAATPATRWALECAVLDLLSRQRNVPLRHSLAPAAPNVVPVNAMLGAVATVTPIEVQTAVAAGFKVLKIKVGLHDPVTELAQLTALTSLLPLGVTLRLDANGAWEFAAAQRMFDGLARLPIESLEEPLRQPNAAHFAALQMAVDFPLARDESLHDVNWHDDLTALGVRRLVLKPAAIGGIRRTLALAQRAQAAGCEVVITSVIDSAVGLWATAQLAAASASAIPHGLATAEWLATDIGDAPLPQHGQLQLPMTPGSGFSLSTI